MYFHYTMFCGKIREQNVKEAEKILPRVQWLYERAKMCYTAVCSLFSGEKGG